MRAELRAHFPAAVALGAFVNLQSNLNGGSGNHCLTRDREFVLARGDRPILFEPVDGSLDVIPFSTSVPVKRQFVSSQSIMIRCVYDIFKDTVAASLWLP